MPAADVRVEGKRGCGWRKPGGIYLVGPPIGTPCCRLPLPLATCPCCGAGIRPARGWTWVDADKLFFPDGLTFPCISIHPPGTIITDEVAKPFCPLSVPGYLGRAGLIWVGEQYYKTPEDFLAEARAMGISRRVTNIPRGFRLGETWVLLAHRKGIREERPVYVGLLKGTGAKEASLIPAVFSVFRPAAIEYVVKGTETESELEAIARRGMTPVEVRRA